MKTIKLKDCIGMYIDIIENNGEKGYSYSEVTIYNDGKNSKTEYGLFSYKPYFKPDEIQNYNSTIASLRENGDMSLSKVNNLIEAVKVHLTANYQPEITNEEIENLDVYVGKSEELTEFLKNGFDEPRLLYINIDWPSADYLRKEYYHDETDKCGRCWRMHM